MTERETLLAEIAALWTVRKIAPDNEFIEATLEQRQARLAELDREPDYEAWRPALDAFCIGQGDDAPNITLDKWDKATIRGLIAAFAKAPPTATAEALEALRHCAETPLSGWTIAQGVARAAIAKIEGEQP